MKHQPTNLRCQGLTEALGIGRIDRPLSFSWNYADVEDNKAFRQDARRIRLHAENAETPVWDSGKHEEPHSGPHFAHELPLSSRTRYRWQLDTWDDGATALPTAEAAFETGLLLPEDWRAEWITGAPQMRTEFTQEAPTERGRLYVSAIEMTVEIPANCSGEISLALPGDQSFRINGNAPQNRWSQTEHGGRTYSWCIEALA